MNSQDGKEINCNFVRKCQTTCEKDETCSLGSFRLNPNGCPLNGLCNCKDPCEDFKCTIPTEICVTQKVECVDKRKSMSSCSYLYRKSLW